MSTRYTEYMRLADLKPALRNPKDHDAVAILNALVRYGYTSPAELDERTGRLVVGHGRREVLIRMRMTGEDRPSGVQLDPETGDWMVPVLRGWSSRDDTEAEAYIIGHNRLGEAGGWYFKGLAEMVEDVIANDAGLIETWGSDDDWIDEITHRIDPETMESHSDPDVLDPEPPEAEDDGDDGTGDLVDDLDEESVVGVTVTCPACQHAFEVRS